MDVFGAPVEAPNMRRIAEAGVRYSNFHTTALCSPTRASPLTGRNATSNGMATIAEFGSGFPGISARIPFENGFISEVLAERATTRTGGGSVGRGTLHRLRNRLRGVLVRIGRLKAAGASEPPNRWLGTGAIGGPSGAPEGRTEGLGTARD